MKTVTVCFILLALGQIVLSATAKNGLSEEEYKTSVTPKFRKFKEIDLDVNYRFKEIDNKQPTTRRRTTHYPYTTTPYPTRHTTRRHTARYPYTTTPYPTRHTTRRHTIRYPYTTNTYSTRHTTRYPYTTTPYPTRHTTRRHTTHYPYTTTPYPTRHTTRHPYTTHRDTTSRHPTTDSPNTTPKFRHFKEVDLDINYHVKEINNEQPTTGYHPHPTPYTSHPIRANEDKKSVQNSPEDIKMKEIDLDVKYHLKEIENKK